MLANGSGVDAERRSRAVSAAAFKSASACSLSRNLCLCVFPVIKGGSLSRIGCLPAVFYCASGSGSSRGSATQAGTIARTPSLVISE